MGTYSKTEADVSTTARIIPYLAAPCFHCSLLSLCPNDYFAKVLFPFLSARVKPSAVVMLLCFCRSDTLLFHGAGVRTGGTFLTGSPVGPWLGALTHPTLAGASSAAQQADAGHAGVRARGAVTVLAFPAGVTLADATAALSII